jgi:RNA polymerase sigma factor (sigma-70 family)
MPAPEVERLVEHLFREQYGKMVAVLTSVFGLSQLGIAEELVQETLIAAMHHWSVREVPDEPRAWLMTVAKNKALNWLKRADTERRIYGVLGDGPTQCEPEQVFLRTDVEDSTLRMIFACCHPDIDESDQLALILKTLGGFGSKEIARALLIGEDAINKRLYRAKQHIKTHGIELEAPGGADLESRLATVCRSLYLLFNEGYLPTEGEEAIRRDLCHEAMRLTSLLARRFPEQPAVHALLALMCFHSARFDSRIDDRGALVLLEEQDRSVWDRSLIARGLVHLSDSARGDQLTTFHLEASIAAQHCTAQSFKETNWRFIHELYQQLYELRPHPLIRLNLAIVVSQVEGIATALTQLERLTSERSLARYPLLHATIGEFARRAGDERRAVEALSRALEMTTSPRQRDVLRAKLALLKN